MARGVNLTSQEWRNIVFEGKNQEFGAYQLRKKSTKRHIFAIIGIIAFLIAVALSVWGYLSYQEMKEAELAEGEKMKNVEIAVDEVQDEDIDDDEVVYQEPEQIEEIPVVEEIAAQAVTEIAIVDEPEKDKEVKSVDNVKENEAQIGNIDKEGKTDITAVQNATKDIVAPPAPAPKEVEPKVEPKKPEPEKIFEAVEQQAQFQGGQGALNKWLSSNLRYPELAQQNNIEGKVIVQFVVEKDGSISNITVARGVDKELDKEAVRVVKKMPKWQPGKNNGVAVRSKFTLPVVFKIQQ